MLELASARQHLPAAAHPAVLPKFAIPFANRFVDTAAEGELRASQQPTSRGLAASRARIARVERGSARREAAAAGTRLAPPTPDNAREDSRPAAQPAHRYRRRSVPSDATYET